MKKIILPITLVVIVLIIIKLSTANTNKTTNIIPESSTVMMHNRGPEEKLRTNMRKLWEDHVTWTRNVIFCIIDDLPGTDQAVNRLLKNQDDIGNAVATYYGAEAGKKLASLLRIHISESGDLLKAAKKGDDKEFDEVNKKWKINADQIAEFLSKANPNLKLSEMKTMMQDHLKLTIDEATARKKKEYATDVTAYEKVHEEILKMSDMISNAVIKQFPDKFKENQAMGMKK